MGATSASGAGKSLVQALAREHAALAGALPDAAVSAARRRAAISQLLAQGLPGGRDENWRYANLRALERSSFAPAGAAPAGTSAAGLTGTPAPAPVPLPAPIPGFTRYLVLDGVLQAAAAAPSCEGVSLGSVGARSAAVAPEADPVAAATTERDADQRFALLNDAFALDALEIRTHGPAAAAPAIELLFVSSGRGAAYPRVQVEVAPGTRLALLERHVGSAGSAISNGLVRVRVGRGARLEHHRLQAQAQDATWIDTLVAEVGGTGEYHLNQYGVGARSARSTIRVLLAEAGAQTRFHCATLAEANQTNDVYARIEHAAPHTCTVENFRGIASGRARVAFNGHIVVQRGASGADSKQSLRTLLGGAGSEIDARPQLEIYTDEVKCSHGATAGKLDEDMLFYLLSRGIEPQTAQSLLKWAFLEDAVAHVAPPPLREAIEALLAAHLKDATVDDATLAPGRRA